jgi:hypothetical protein
MLLLAGPAFAEALYKKYCLQHPQIWLGGETSTGENLWSDVVVDTNLRVSVIIYPWRY